MSGDTASEATGQSDEAKQRPLFREITADDYDPEITEIESLCVSCEEQGMTRLFLTKIPFFREVIVSSFACEHCGMRNTEIQSAGRLQDKGSLFKVTVKSHQDLNRQVVLSSSASVRIPVLDFEAPPTKGYLTTVEGVVSQACDDLEQGQIIRRIQEPEVAAKIDEFIGKMKKLLTLETPFDIEVDDPAGNSFVENPVAPERDPQMVINHYTRSRQQDIDLCIINEDAEVEEEEEEVLGVKDGDFNSTNEVLHFPANCPHCNAPCETNMKVVNIPHFKEVVIMATNCESCGHRDNEVKSGGGMEEKGRRISLFIKDREDLSRDVLKSETSSVLIPELDFETDMGTLGGKFTTVEGLLQDFVSQLQDQNPFMMGDSSKPESTSKMSAFCEKLSKVVKGETLNVSIILDDPAGNSYIQSLTSPDPDPQLKVEDYERSWQQREDLGLNDMKTENYEET